MFAYILDEAVINLGIALMLPDPFCSRPPAWPLLLVRPEFKVYTRSSNKAFTLSLANESSRFIQELNEDEYFQRNRQVVFIVHGFLGNNKCTPWLNSMKDAILKEDDSTVFIVDWRFGADIPEYGIAASNTQTTAMAIAAVANAILYSQTFKGNKEGLYFYCIGHSLGAHTCGQAGRQAKTENGELLFDRITGLDPAGPGFALCDTNMNINKDSALCVDIIHTDGSLKGHFLPALHFGTLSQWGHIDFYPNAGQDQPGCTALGNDCGCSHKKAPEFFLFTIGRPETCEATGWCSNVESLPESCSNVTKQLMGYYSPCYYKSNQFVEGAFYVDVKSDSPYC